MRNKHLSLTFGAIATLFAVGCATTASVEPNDYSVFRIASVSEGKKKGECGPVNPHPTTTHKSTFRAGATFLAYGITTTSGEQLFLDIGDQVLVGSLKADGSYEFKGTVTDTQEIGGMTIFDSNHDNIDDSEQTFVDADGDGLNDKTTANVPDDMVDTDGDLLDDRFEDNLVDADDDGLDDRQVELPGDTILTDIESLTISFVAAEDTIAGDGVLNVKTKCDGPQCDTFEALNCTTTTSFIGIEINDPSIAIPIGDSPTP